MAKAEYQIRMELSLCNGCRSCEIGCSYHHAKVFDPSKSSIRIFRNDATGEVEYRFLASCDLCRNEQTPFCVKYCAPRALTLA